MCCRTGWHDLVTLPGFGRKTANVVLGHAFGIPGITVDTHVGRLVRRWGLTEQTDPVQVELELNVLLPPSRLDDVLGPGDLPRPTGVPREEAGLRRLLPGGAVPVLRRRARPSRTAARRLVVGAERPHLLALAGLAESGMNRRASTSPARIRRSAVPSSAWCPTTRLPDWLAADGRPDRRWSSTHRSAARPALCTAPRAGRRSAVLMLFADGPRARPAADRAGQHPARACRAARLPRWQAGPGRGRGATALREGAEETGLRPESVTPVALFPDLFLGFTGFLVSPVLAYWREPGPVGPVDPAETAAVARVPVAELVDPANRGRVRHPGGYVGPAFEVADMVVWGFTAGLVEMLLDLGGWSQPWDRQRYIDLPEVGCSCPTRRPATR